MGYDIPAAAAQIAQWQSGTVSRQQLLEAGLSAQLIKRRLERGRWQQLHWGVYAVFTGPPPRKAWLWAAVLRAGPGAVLSHLTAAELHGLLDTPAEAIFVTVPSTRRISAPELVVRMSSRIAEATQPGRQPPRTGVEETVLDLAELAWTFDDACGWLTQACGRRMTTAAKLEQARHLRKKMRWRTSSKTSWRPPPTASTRRSSTAICATWSGRMACRGHGVRCAWSSTARPSTATPTTTSTSWPSNSTASSRTRTRIAGVTAAETTRRAPSGILTARYGWRDVYGHPCETALLQARILRKRGWTGQPRPCSPACPVAAGVTATIDLRSLRRSRQPLGEAPRLTY